MNNTNSRSFTIPTTIIIQPTISKTDSKSNKRIFRLGWATFILGFCAFVAHYISLERLRNFSPINAGIVSGFFLMISGLASVAAGYKENSYKYFIHAHIWSFITNIIIAPGLIAVSVTALIIDSNDMYPACQSSVPLLQRTIYQNTFETDSLNLPCIRAMYLFNLAQIFNAFQLIIGAICFIVHVFLLSAQRKIIRKMKTEQNHCINKVIFCTESNEANQNHPVCYSDTPPKYEDLHTTQTIQN